MARAKALVEALRRAREYTNQLLSDSPTPDWFWMPHEGVSHIAWQVGHLTYAQYRLTLERVRGERADDEQLFPVRLREKFGRGSTPAGDPRDYPPAEEIRRAFDAVHRQALEEVSKLSDAVLDEPTAAPHPRFSTKGAAIDWCAAHEMIHAGQIGLLRRLRGKAPLW